MMTLDEAKNALRDARVVLNCRRIKTRNADEKLALATVVDNINKDITRGALEDLAAASQRVSETADALEAILRTAHVHVFDCMIDASLRSLADTAVKFSDLVSRDFVFDAPRALDLAGTDDEVNVAVAAHGSSTDSAAAGRPGTCQ